MKSLGISAAEQSNSERECNPTNPTHLNEPARTKVQTGECSDTSAPPQQGGPLITHGLVRFGRLYGIYYIPEKVRPSIQVGELVLVEAAHGTNTGTLVADYSAEVAEVRRNYAQHPYLSYLVGKAGNDDAAREQVLDDVLAPEDRIVAATKPADEATASHASHESSTSLHSPPGKEALNRAGRARFELYAKAPVSGLPEHDNLLQRLPRVLRRGVNKDKKKVYFSHKRDTEALHLVARMLFERNWSTFLSISSVSYQVDFLSITIFLNGGEELYGNRATALSASSAPNLSDANSVNITRWGPQEYTSVGATMSAPLRTDIVEFRFCAQFPELAHLTRNIMGNFFNLKCEADILLYDRMQSSQGGPPTNIVLPVAPGSTGNSAITTLHSSDPTAAGAFSMKPFLPLAQGGAPQHQPAIFASTASGTFTSPLHTGTAPAMMQATAHAPLQRLVPALLASAQPGSVDNNAALSPNSTPTFSQRYSLTSTGSFSWITPTTQHPPPQHQHRLTQQPPLGAPISGHQRHTQTPALRLASFSSVGTATAPSPSAAAAHVHGQPCPPSGLPPPPPSPQQQQQQQYQQPTQTPPAPQILGFIARPAVQVGYSGQGIQMQRAPAPHTGPPGSPQQPNQHQHQPTYYYLPNQQESSNNNTLSSNDHGGMVHLNLPMARQTPSTHPHEQQQRQQQQQQQQQQQPIIYMLAGAQSAPTPCSPASPAWAGGPAHIIHSATTPQESFSTQQRPGDYPMQTFHVFPNYQQ